MENPNRERIMQLIETINDCKQALKQLIDQEFDCNSYVKIEVDNMRNEDLRGLPYSEQKFINSGSCIYNYYSLPTGYGIKLLSTGWDTPYK